MKKIFWVGIGIAVGSLAYHKLTQARAQATTAEGWNRTIGRVGDSIADTLDAFREGMSAKESELRDALGLDQPQRGRHAGGQNH
ncbi:hypothetical protein [Zhihengliuella sp.]|uniref:hypothetical protein n=1 Tax=Zhihengliuella sp. TaxID=1954483 RepID=UPI002811D679|nr:hypothetical protein [Zhihengliuella sp.]